MNIESRILDRYKQFATTEEPNLDLLFDIISDFIKEKRWIYDGSERIQDVCILPEESEIIVNCFDLADLFVNMAIKIGISPELCHRIKLPNFVSNNKGNNVQGSYQSNFSTLLTNDVGLYEFDVHCIAMIDGFCFDLTLQAKYSLINDGVDIYSSLLAAMYKDDVVDFKHVLPDLFNINEQSPDTGWTLMHSAISEKKHHFAKLLLENGATDNIPDNNNVTALDILIMDIHDTSTLLKDLYQAQEYLTLKMELVIQNKMKQLDIENRSARVIQSFWREKRAALESTTLPLDLSAPAFHQGNN